VLGLPGKRAVAAVKWRVAEVTDTNAPATIQPGRTPMRSTPPGRARSRARGQRHDHPILALKVGHAYRVRVSFKDTTGRWSNWSAPVQFVTGPPDTAAALVGYLRVTELMFDPPAGSVYEFIELKNTSDAMTLDSKAPSFTSGVDFTFPAGTFMAPGSYLLVVKDH